MIPKNVTIVYSKAKWFHVVDQTNGDEGEVYMDVYTIGFPGKAIWMHLEDEEEFKLYYDWDKI